MSTPFSMLYACSLGASWGSYSAKKHMDAVLQDFQGHPESHCEDMLAPTNIASGNRRATNSSKQCTPAIGLGGCCLLCDASYPVPGHFMVVLGQQNPIPMHSYRDMLL